MTAPESCEKFDPGGSLTDQDRPMYMDASSQTLSFRLLEPRSVALAERTPARQSVRVPNMRLIALALVTVATVGCTSSEPDLSDESARRSVCPVLMEAHASILAGRENAAAQAISSIDDAKADQLDLDLDALSVTASAGDLNSQGLADRMVSAGCQDWLYENMLGSTTFVASSMSG